MKKLICLFSALIILMGIFSVTAYADYENTHENTGVYYEDLTSVALTQVGYKTDGTLKYGTDKNNSLSFLLWCAGQADIPGEVIPQADTVTELYDFFSGNMMVNSNPEHIPQNGDIMFLGEGDTAEECAIVIFADEEYIFAVICESDKAVRKKMYTMGMSKIIGYATPDYSYISNMVPGNHITIASTLNLRSEPNTDCDVLAKIPLGTSVHIEEISEEWGRITYNGITGWIHMDYTVLFDDDHTEASEYAVKWHTIDVSKWQGDIDWSKVYKSNISAVLIRIGLRGSETREVLFDDEFFEYYNGAKAQGLHVGCYFYSTATNEQEALEEARFVIDAIREHDLEFDMPVYYDMEDRVTERCGKTMINKITRVFLDEMKDENIYSGVYCNISWVENYYNASMFEDHALWIAEWHEKCAYKNSYGMWQYTDKGSISGVESRYTDLNICYINYPALIADSGYNVEIEKPEKEILPGDVNSDKKITASDARLALRIAANLHTPTDDEKTAADINSDGKITASDARKILRKAANLE